MNDETINAGQPNDLTAEIKKLEDFTSTASYDIDKIEKAITPTFNRKQRRFLNRKTKNDAEVIAEITKKLGYIDLIQKLRELNKKKENEVYEDDGKDD